jgi:uncharacterized protein with HEPN domain
MSREINKLMTDIDKSINMIEAYLQYVPTLTEFKSDTLITDAIHRRLSIIGEALWKADKLDPDLLITDKKRIISFRHILIHDYDLLSEETIWMICNKHLPILKTEVQTILNIK